MMVNSQGFLVSSTSEGNMDRTLTQAEWQCAANIVLEAAIRYCSAARAAAIRKHHSIVAGIAAEFSWLHALEYDIASRKKVEVNPKHDIGSSNPSLITWVGARIAAKRTAEDSQTQAAPAKKPRFGSSSASHATSSNAASNTHCFRCGRSGHLPSACRATTTITGRPAATIAGGTQSPNALADASGTPFCFLFARSSSCSRASCRYLHSCSICGADHGAGKCPRSA